MMKKILLPALLLAAFPAAAEEIAEDCTFGGGAALRQRADCRALRGFQSAQG